MTVKYCPPTNAYIHVQGYFDTLRMEVADKGIEVQSVCPGPVDTPFMRDIFGKELYTDRCQVKLFRKIDGMYE